MRIYIYIFITCFIVSVFSDAFSCNYIDEKHITNHLELVLRTKDIVKAKFIKTIVKKNNKAKYYFKVEEVLKGNVREMFHLNFNMDKAQKYFSNIDSDKLKKLIGSKKLDFNNHIDNSFWDKKNTFNYISPDCNFHPLFFSGNHSYLIFINKPYHVHSFEMILSTDDLWYKRIKYLVNEKRNIDFLEYLNGFESIYISNCPSRKSRSRHDTLEKIVFLKKGNLNRYKHPLVMSSYLCMGKKRTMLVVHYTDDKYRPIAIPIINNVINAELIYKLNHIIDSENHINESDILIDDVFEYFNKKEFKNDKHK